MITFLPRLRRFAFAMTGSWPDADDLVQETCERAIRNLGQWQVGSRLDSWMYRIAQNLYRNAIRDSKTRERLLREASLEQPGAGRGEDAAIARLTLGEVAQSIDSLPEEQRVVLLLVVVEGRGYREAADILDLPIGTVTSRLSRAREAVKRCAGGDTE